MARPSGVPARLPGRQDPGPGRFIRRHEGGDLTGLAGSVAALEGDEYPVAHPGEPKPRLRQGLLALGEFPQESGRDLAGGVAGKFVDEDDVPRVRMAGNARAHVVADVRLGQITSRDPTNNDLDAVQHLLAPAPDELLTMYAVDTAVNNVRNHGAELIRRAPTA